MNKTELHAAIMNLPCKPPALTGANEVWAYQYGHRDARHAAAELSLSASQPQEEGDRKDAPIRPPSLAVALNMCREANTEAKLPTPMCWDLALYVARLESFAGIDAALNQQEQAK
jgi:hypothetical protein